MVFFFGGGWTSGNRTQLRRQARHFSRRGLVCFMLDYRIKNVHGTSPVESLKDAKSGIRFIRENAATFNIDENKLIVSGASAGGQLAAATALISDYNESTDNMSVSCIPNALVLFNPVIDNGPCGYGNEKLNVDYKTFSPINNIRSGAPPTIIFLGTNDNLIPVKTIEDYKSLMDDVGSRCDIHFYEGQGHGFFNFSNFEFYKKTVIKADEFLVSLGYLDTEPVVPIVDN
jgi:acetyl esterase/lipase